MRSTDDQSTIRWLLVVGLYCFRGLKIDFNQNLSLCDRCTKSVRVYQHLDPEITSDPLIFCKSKSISFDKNNFILSFVIFLFQAPHSVVVVSNAGSRYF